MCALEFNNETSHESSCSSLLADIRAMRQREPRYTVKSDFLHQPELMASNDTVDVACRQQMCDWCVQIAAHCEFSLDTVAIAMNLLDRFLEASTWALQDRSAFQLAAITSLYTSVKIHEPMAISVDIMVKLSRSVYTAAQIESMERVLLDANKWLVHPPSTFRFAAALCDYIGQQILDSQFFCPDTLVELTELQLQSALQDYELSFVNSSSIAMAAVLNAVEGMNMQKTLQSNIEHELARVSEMTANDSRCVRDIRIRLYESLGDAPHVDSKHAPPTRPRSPRSVSAVRTGA